MSRFEHVSRVVAIAAACASALMGCTGDEVVAPVEGAGGGSSSASSTSGSGSSSGSTSQSSSSTGGGPPIRSVFTRNPFGEQVGEQGPNLLADGDFDLSFGFAGQQGWTAFDNAGQRSLVAETGGLCKSGLRCARVSSGTVLFGRGTTAADEQDMRATIWVKPTEGTSCPTITAQVLGCDSFFPRATLMRNVGDGEDGWCAFSATITGAKVATCLYVENDSGQDVLFDAATMFALATDEARRLPPSPVIDVSPERKARRERVRDRIRDTLPLGAPPRRLDD